jgi:release factor glutamine methyltransferase
VSRPDVVTRLRVAGCVWAEDEAELLEDAAASADELEALLARRVAGEPLETVLGWVGFLGRRLVVTPGVFVPRRRTELLARTALDRVHRFTAAAARPPLVVEMCCGVAPVAACLEGRAAAVHAADVSRVALECARANAPSADLHLGDLYDALPPRLLGRVDVLVANAPYVPTGRVADMPPEARDHEPLVALDGGTDGVDLHRRLARDAGRWLAPGGVLLVETSPGQAGLTTAAMTEGGLSTHVAVDDEVGGCVAIGVRPAAVSR